MRLTRFATAVVVAVALVTASAVARAQTASPVQAASIAQALDRSPLPTPMRPLSADERRATRAIYAAEAFAPRWLINAVPYRATTRATEAIAALSGAGVKGLEPAHYGADWLRVQSARTMTEDDAARFEATLSFAMMRYLSDVGFGRIDPASMGFALPGQRRRDGIARAVPAVMQSLTTSTAPLSSLAESIEPRLPTYPRLIEALGRFRRMAALPALPLPPPPTTRIYPGDRYPGAAALRALLARHGDLAPSAPAGPGAQAGAAASGAASAATNASADDLFDTRTADALRRFQARHGLDADGVPGRATWEALAVSPAERVRQIELSLERLRWLGQLPDERFVAINIPQFRLWAVPARGDEDKPLSMRVIVGTAMTDTPVFVDAIEAVEFQPYWNVPVSIATRELFPKMARDPAYLARERMEQIGGAGLHGDALLHALGSGAARIRQLPGPGNALGKIKFVMPNRHSVYLHDTPSRQLFARSRRDFSHGCIRLENPQALANFVMRGRSSWDRERTQQAIASDHNQVAHLDRPVPVLIYYSTVGVAADGQVSFFPDVYGLDRKLRQTLDTRWARAEPAVTRP